MNEARQTASVRRDLFVKIRREGAVRAPRQNPSTMSTTSDEAKQKRLLWLVGVGYVLMAVGALLLLLLCVLLPVNFLDGPNHYYRVVPTERG